MKARYRYRVSPTDQQKIALAQLFGCCRVVWNDALAFCQESYSKGEQYPGESQLQKQFITQAKKTENREWLKEVSSIALQQSVQDLNKAYQNFFNSCKGKRKGKKVKLPRFKKRKSAQSARLTKGGFKVHQNNIKIAKIGKLKIKWTRPLPNEPTSVTIIKDSADRYFVSFVVEINPSILPQSDQSCGIDLGIIDFATFDDGTKVKAPKPLKKKLKRLRKLQRNLSRKVKGSKRREVARKKLAKLHAKIKDSRTDFLHKLSTKVIQENQLIALEDLNVSGMVKNRKLARAISDLGWRSFRTMLEAKAKIYGRDFRVIDRWEPTSQKCSFCGEKGGKKRNASAPSHGAWRRTKLELSVREWTCLFCNTIHDRDVNASKNILNACTEQCRSVAEGHSETQGALSNGEGTSPWVAPQNGRGDRRKTTSKVVAVDEASTTPRYKQLSLF